MEILEKVFNKELDINSGLLNRKICFLDIETTGLNRSTDSIYLIGLVFYDNEVQGWKMVQLFAEELKEEIDVLLEAYKLLEVFDLIINYNGNSFDIPFINSKLKFYKTDLSIDMDKSLDLYRIIQANKKILQLHNYKLKTIEEYLGIYREDKITGRECINLYFDYLITKNSISKANILLHNYEDLYYLLDVIKIIDILKHKKSFLINCSNMENIFLIEEINLNKDYLLIKGKIDNNSIGNTVYFAENYKIIISNDDKFEVSLEVKEGLVSPTQRCVFINVVDYDLPRQGYYSNQFKLPKGIVLLSVEKNYFIENLKLVLERLIDRTVN